MKENSNYTFLALTADQTFWDTTQPILAINQSCIDLSRPEKYEHIDIRMQPPPERNPQSLSEHYHAVTAIYEEVLHALSEWLNKTHSTKYNLKFWRILIGPFLISYIDVVCQHFRHLQIASSSHTNLNTIGLSKECFQVPSSSADAACLLKASDTSSLQLYTQLIEIYFTTIKLRYQKQYQGPNEIPSARSLSLLRRIKQQSVYIYSLLRRNKLIDISYYHHGFTKRDILKLFFYSKGRIIPLGSFDNNQSILYKHVPTSEIRKEIAYLNVKQDLSRVVLKTLEENFPSCFIESFRKLQSASKKTRPFTALGAITYINTSCNEIFKFWSATQATHYQTKLIFPQHGAYYKQAAYSVAEAFERHDDFAFVSWGTRGKNTYTCSSSIVSKYLPFSPKEDRECLLLATNIYSKQPQAFEDIALSGYLSAIGTFLQQALPTTLKHLKLRTHPGFQYNEYIQCIFTKYTTTLPGNKSTHFIDDLKQARLVICDHIGTLCHYSLAFNIPTIIFCKPELFPARPSYAKDLQPLKEVKILHDSPESAANFLNSNLDHIETWWALPETQRARAAYCYKHARTSKNYLKEWRDLLIKLCDAS